MQIYDSRIEMGAAAAVDIKACIISLLKEKSEINMIYAAAPSQNEVLTCLANDKEIPWNRIHAYHMDEYIGLPVDAPQGFGNFMRAHLFDLVPFDSVNCVDCTAPDAEAECRRYEKLLAQNPADIVVMGIGENGYIAFNDPPVANFNGSKMVKSVKLDQICRNQQVNDGCFASTDLIPTQAITPTSPALVAVPRQYSAPVLRSCSLSGARRSYSAACR